MEKIPASIHLHFPRTTHDDVAAIYRRPLLIENVFHGNATRLVMPDPVQCCPREDEEMGFKVVGYRVPRSRTREQPGGHELPGPLWTVVNTSVVR